MIDTSTWKEFSVGDLFRIEPTKGKNQQELIEGNEVPYIAASKENNGFNRMVSVEDHEDWVSKGNCLQFVHIGDAAAGHVNYIPNDFIGMSGKSSCAYNDNLNEYNGLFIASIIVHTNNGKYSFKDSWTGSKVPDTIIKLPATSDGQPDWDYMESYMKAVMEESEKSLENLKKADNTKHLIDVSGWGEFRIGDLFDVSRGRRHVVGNHEEGDLPYYSASLENNGVTDYICNPLFTDKDGLVVTTFGDAFYAKGEFTASDEITILHHNKMNELSGLFIASTIRSHKWKYSFKVKAFQERVSNDIIKLPVTSTGEPDWQYMEDYMKNIMNKQEMATGNLLKIAQKEL